MTNNSKSTSRKAKWLQSEQKRLSDALRAAGSYDALTKKLGIPNKSYLANFIIHGWIPSNKKIQKAMGLYAKSQEGQDYAAASQKAKDAGYASWYAYRRAVAKGEAEIYPKLK